MAEYIEKAQKKKRIKCHVCANKMYIRIKDDIPVAYAYGEPWVAQALFMGDIGYDTPEEAKAAWERGI